MEIDWQNKRVALALRDEEGTVLEVELQAVLTKRTARLDWQTLQNNQQWKIGWLT